MTAPRLRKATSVASDTLERHVLYWRRFKLDALRSSHPIEVDVQSPNQINQIFDAISYSKGKALP